jgi:hypothetical protein
MGSPLTLEHLGSHEEIVGGTGDVTQDPDWFVQLKDGQAVGSAGFPSVTMD